MTAEVTALAARFTERARAKLNLFLHVRGRRPDGYHELESLVVFPEIGDVLEMEPGRGLSLSLDGPFADGLGNGADNLVIQAAEQLGQGRRGAALRLSKNLPVASGIGGGSADAAAALRLLARAWNVPLPTDRGLTLGADVPVCLSGCPAIMSGIGERLSPAPAFPQFWVLLVNPLVGVPTGAVFSGLATRDNHAGPDAPPGGFHSAEALADWLGQQRNDLEAPAKAICPPIAEILDALRGIDGCLLGRMSGSGATCFGVFSAEQKAMAAADSLRRAYPGWWVSPAPVLSSSG